MIDKCLQSYSYLIDKTYFSPHTFLFNSIKCYKTLCTEFFTTNTFHLSCFEDTFITCIELSVINKEFEKYPFIFNYVLENMLFFAQNAI